MKISKKIESSSILKIFIGIIFLSAGIYRIFSWQKAVLEISSLGLPYANIVSAFIVLLEISGGLLLIFNIKSKQVCLVFGVFIALALVAAMLAGGQNIIANSAELFFFNATPTDFFLHFTYLIILLYLFFNAEKN